MRKRQMEDKLSVNNRRTFEPVWDGNSRILILGTFPSPLSFAEGFYYGHPRNRFWPLLAGLLGEPTPRTVAQKRALLLGRGVALWDVLETCDITGAADSTIRNPVPNDIGALLQKAPVQQIFCNGAKAYQLFQKFQGDCPLPACKLPSTSPANAAFSLERLLAAWAVILPGLEG